MMNKGGVSPCDRRIDRRKVAMAACAAVLLFATRARADIITFDVDESLSSLGFVERITAGADTFVFHKVGTTFTASDPGLTPGIALTGAYSYLASSTTGSGIFDADVFTGTSIKFSPVGAVNYFTNTYSYGLGPGVYYPFYAPNSTTLVAPPGGVDPGQKSQFGFEISHKDFGAGFGFARVHQLRQQFGNAGTGAVDGGPIIGYSAGTTYAGYTGVNALMASLGGIEDVYGIVVDTIDLTQAGPSSTPFPSPFAGNPITWDGVTLTIPVNFHLNFTDDDGLIYDIDTFGAIVAHPYVPEPSTMLLLGCGVAGLLSYAWRARKRRALVA
jgi:hypothetical protein